MARELSQVGVVGLGTMGAGITEVLARAGLDVTAVEVSDEALERGRGHLEQSTDKAVQRGKLDAADRDAVLARVRWSTSLEDLAEAELVIEAIPERLELKTEVFARGWTRSARRTRSWRPTPRACRSPSSAWPPAGRARSSGCTSSTRRRS